MSEQNNENKKLELAVNDFLQAPGEEKFKAVVNEIKDKALFVPAMEVPEKGGYQPYVMKNPEGEMFMPAYTAEDKFPDQETYETMLKLPYQQCVSMLIDHETPVKGILLNPAAEGSLLLKKKMLELSRQIERDEQQAANPNLVTLKIEDFHMVTRHVAEFHQIPAKLYEEKEEFIRGLSKEKLCELYKNPYIELEQEGRFPYTEDDFEMMELNISDDLYMVQVTAPAKNLVKTTCREIYYVCNPNTQKVGCYGIEKGSDPGQPEYFLDEIKEGGEYEQLEEAPSEGNVINRVIELFEAVQEKEGSQQQSFEAAQEKEEPQQQS